MRTTARARAGLARHTVGAAIAVMALLGATLIDGPAAGAAVCSGSTLNVVAHMDDDLLFLSPDIQADIDAGRCVRTVVVTAGDDGQGPSYWLGRETGGRAAYNSTIGTTAGWTQSDAGIPGTSITVFTSNANNRVSLAFMRLPDGNADGSGSASTGYVSLKKLWTGTISSMTTVDGSTTYTRASLQSTLTALMVQAGADTIRTQDWVGAYGDVDHSDHHSVAYLTRAAAQNYGTPHTAYSYMDYESWGAPQNVFGAELVRKSNSFYAYGVYDTGACGSAAYCAGTVYETWLGRRYIKASETGGAPAPVLSVSSGSLGFGSVVVGGSGSRVLTVSNTGSGVLTFSAVTGPVLPFSVVGLPVVGSTLAPGASATVTVGFAPSVVGAVSGSLVLVSDGGSATVGLSGTGTAAPPPGGGVVPGPEGGGWTLNGNASITGGALQLTPAAASQRGSAFWPTAVSSSNLDLSFDADIGGGTGADGLTLTLANPSAGASALGALGGGLGFAGISGVAVALDTWQNWSSSDVSNNFVGVATGFSGSTDNLTYVATSTAVPQFSGSTHRVRVVTVPSGSGVRLTVAVDGVTVITTTAVTLPPSVLIGFTAGTGSTTNRHTIRNTNLVTGTAAPAPVLSVSSGSLGFGSVVVGGSGSRVLTVSNTGSGVLTFSAVTGPVLPFSVVGLPVVGSTLAPGASATVTVGFAPSVVGAVSGSLVLVSDGGSATVGLSGTGTAAPPPGGGVVPGPEGGGWTLNGNASITGGALQLTPAAASQRGSAFWPTAVSSSNLDLSFDADIGGGTGADGLTLTLANPSAGASALGALGGGLGFAGISGVAVALDTWQNWSSSDVSNNFVGVATGFSGSTDNLTYVATSTAVPQFSGSTHRVRVVTVPSGSGVRLTVAVDGVTVITTTAVTLPPSVLIGFTAGTGSTTNRHTIRNTNLVTGTAAPAPVLSVSSGSLGFGSVVVGGSGSRVLTVSNTGSGVLTFSAVTGPVLPFSVVGLPVVGSTLAPGASATVTVGFAPSVVGAVSGSLVLVSDGGSATVGLSGTGTAAPPPGGGVVPGPEGGGWTLNGNASITGGALQLTPAAASQRGSAFWPTAVSSSNLDLSFDADIGGGTGADGLTLTLANPSAGASALGALGGGLGFAGISGVAVALDTWQNWSSSDVSNNFVGVATGFSGSTDNLTYVATSTAVPQFSGSTHRVRVVTVPSGSGVRLTVAVDGVTVITTTAVTLPPSVLIGFTAGTGSTTNRHTIRNTNLVTG